MSNQLQITGGAKVRSLEGVITGTSGVLSSVPLGGANGVATLDSGGKVPVSQLPSSVVTYLGTWDASTNTPTLTNGTGDAGDMYICNVAGTVNFGAGPITFAVGDWVLYGSGTWQKSNGQNGTVTSVGLTAGGNALTITNSPITTAGDINVGFAGSSTQYIAGDGTLVTFPTIITEAQNLITDVYNETGATLTKGTVVYINGGHGNLPTITKALATSDATSAQTYGVVQADITNNNNGHVVVIGSLGDLDTQAYAAGTQLYLSSTTAGAWTSVKQYAPAHLVYVGIVVRSHPTQGVVEIKIQNGFELDELHNVSAQTPSNGDILQYDSTTSLWTSVAGTTTNIAEGSNLYFTNARAIGSTLTGYVSGAGTISSTDSILTAIQKLNGNVSGLVTGVSSVFGRTGAVVAASGDYTTTEVTEGTNLYFTNARARGAMSANVGSALTYDSATGRYTLLAADSGTSGYLTAADWTDFDSKQASLGTGTTSQYLRGDLTWATPPTPTLDDLTDVVITTPTNGQVLTYRFGDWKNETPASAPVTSVFGRTGVVVATSGDYNTDLVTEGTTNLYYTNTRARAALSANVGSALTYNSSTGRFTLDAADGTVAGYVTAADYNYWSAKQASLGTGTTSQYLRGDLTWSSVPAPALDDLTDVTITTPSNGQLLRYQAGTWINFTPTYISLTALSATAPLSYDSGTGVFSISQATTSTNGYLSSTDWNTFNNKQSALTNPVTGTGTTNYLPKFTGTSTIGNSAIYDNGGNIGIGITNAVVNLQVNGSAEVYSALSVSGTRYMQFGADATANYINSYNGVPLIFSTSATTSFSQKMILTTSGNLGLGVTPSAWDASFKALQIGLYAGLEENSGGGGGYALFGNSYEYSVGAYKYLQNYYATMYRTYAGQHQWFNAPSGTAGNAISFTQAMTLSSTGNLLIGTTTDAGYKLDVNGTGRFSGTLETTTIQSFNASPIYLFSTATTSNYEVLAIDKTATDARIRVYKSGTGSYRDLVFETGGTTALRLASTGAATFSSSVTALQGIFRNSGVPAIQAIRDLNVVSVGTAGQGIEFGALNGTTPTAGAAIYGTLDNPATTGSLIFQTLNAGTLGTRLTIAPSGAATFSAATNTSTWGLGLTNSNSTSFYAAHPGGYGMYVNAGTNASSSTYIATFVSGGVDRLYVRGDGNVGIGTSSPSGLLHVNGTSYIDTSSGNNLVLRKGTGQGALVWGGTNASEAVFLQEGISGGGMAFYTSSGTLSSPAWTERMRITSTGNVGIGTSSPVAPLSIPLNTTNSQISTGSIEIQSYAVNNSWVGDNVYFNGSGFYRRNTGYASQIYLGNSDGSIRFNNGASSTAGTSISFSTTLMIAGGGNVLIGTTTDAGYKLDVSGQVRATAFFESSDKRLKKELIDNPTSINIENIKPKLYIKDGKEELGYYAQDLQSILPSAVTESKDGFLSLSYTQVHTAKIASLEREVAELKELIKTLIK